MRPLAVSGGEAVGKRQGELRDGVGTGLGDVVARDGHGVVVANAVIDVVLLHVAEDGVILRHEWKAFFDQVLVKEFGAEPLTVTNGQHVRVRFAPQTMSRASVLAEINQQCPALWSLS